MRVGVREFSKELYRFQNEIVEVIDKKSGTLKGIYLPAKVARRFQEWLNQQRQESQNTLLDFAGKFESEKIGSKKEQRRFVAKAKAKIS